MKRTKKSDVPEVKRRQLFKRDGRTSCIRCCSQFRMRPWDLTRLGFGKPEQKSFSVAVVEKD